MNLPNQDLNENGKQITQHPRQPPWYIRIFVFSILMIFAPQIASKVADHYGVDLNMPLGEFMKNLLITVAFFVAIIALGILVFGR